MKLIVSNISGKELSLVKTTLKSGDSIIMYVPDEVYLGQEILTDAVEKMLWDDIHAFETAGYVTITAVPQGGSGELALANGKVFIGNASNIAIENAVSGDVTISNVGVTAIGAKKVANTMIAAAAGTVLVGTKTSGDVTKLDCSTAGALAIGQGAGETVAAHALSGDVTMNKDGVTAIGANKVDYSKVALANGKVLIGDSSGHAIEEVLSNIATYVTVKVSLTNAQVKALATTAIQVVAAPGANKVAEVVTALLRLNAGTNVLTCDVGDDLAFRWVDASGVICSQPIETTGFIDQAATTYTNGRQKINAIATVAQCVNQPVMVHNTGSNFAGNAANDATLDVWIHYRIYDVA